MYIKRFIKKLSLVAMPAISFLSVSTACTKSDIVGLGENERVYKENKEKHDSIFETILQLPNSNPKDINSYKTFTSTFLTRNDDNYYFLTSRNDLNDVNQNELNISLATLKTNNPKPFYFLSGKTQFNIVLKDDHYLVYSIQKTNLSSNWNNRVIKAPNHGSSPFLYEISQNNAQLETLNFANTSKISKNDILSYTPIDNHMLVTSQASFVNSKTFNSLKSIISSLSEEVARTADKLSYKNLSYISNQFLGSPLFYNKNIIGVLSSYKNTKNNHVTMNIVDFYIFTDQDIKNIKNAINMDGV